MNISKTFVASIAFLPGIIVCVEILLRTSLAKRINDIHTHVNKVFHVIKSPNVSDHWKEKVIPVYARRILYMSLIILLQINFILVIFIAVYVLAGLFFFNDFKVSYNILINYKSQLIIVFLGITYGLTRKYVIQNLYRRKENIQQYYTLTSKFLHHLALDSRIMREVSFDIDCVFTKKLNNNYFDHSAPVYVSGLARAGTTLLLEALYSTNQFCTLTYRDMPFITAPYLWRKISKHSSISGSLKERAHDDDVLINYDSPEALEEIFWKTFLKDKYIGSNYLQFHSVDNEVQNKYQKYVQNIIYSALTSNSTPRYLAKNNNNLLRISSIKSVFPNVCIIVPFRNPYAHAHSLLRQHNLFLRLHQDDPFTLRYMNWLGHHEFGKNMKPFYVDEDIIPSDNQELTTIEYWLKYWIFVYKYLIETYKDKVIFFDYDQFCNFPGFSLSQLSKYLKLDFELLKPFVSNVKYPNQSYLQDHSLIQEEGLFVLERLKKEAINSRWI